MKKFILLSLMCLLTFVNASSQKISKEIQRLMNEYETVKKDTTKTLDVRKIATFKYDALYYLTIKASKADNFSETEYGKQASAMIDFVNLFVSQYEETKSKSKKTDVIYKFMNVSTSNSLFNDEDKDVTYAYVNNSKYITEFSLDTDWVKALVEVKK